MGKGRTRQERRRATTGNSTKSKEAFAQYLRALNPAMPVRESRRLSTLHHKVRHRPRLIPTTETEVVALIQALKVLPAEMEDYGSGLGNITKTGVGTIYHGRARNMISW